MRFLRFNLAGLMVLTAAASIVMVPMARWRDWDAQGALEMALVAIWLLTMLIAWRTIRPPGRSRRVAVLVAVVWTLGVFATHFMFVSEMQAYGLPLALILRRAAMVALAGSLAAVMFAWLSHAIPLAYGRVKACTPRFADAALGLLMVCLPAGLVVHQTTRWHARPISSDERAGRRDMVAFIYGQLQNADEYDYRRAGRFILAGSADELLVFDARTAQRVTQLAPSQGMRLVHVLETTDGNYVSAIQLSNDDAQPRAVLVRWDTYDWSPAPPVELPWLDDLPPTTRRFNSLSRDWLIAASIDTSDPEKYRATVLAMNLRAEQLEFEPFGCFDIPIEHDSTKLSYVAFQQGWMVSRDGEYIVLPRGYFQEEVHHVFCRSTQTCQPWSDRILGFYADSHVMVSVKERSWPYWKGPEAGGDRPPFWDHFRPGWQQRVILTDLSTSNVVARSPWLRGGAYLDRSGTQVIVRRYSRAWRLEIDDVYL